MILLNLGHIFILKRKKLLSKNVKQYMTLRDSVKKQQPLLVVMPAIFGPTTPVLFWAIFTRLTFLKTPTFQTDVCGHVLKNWVLFYVFLTAVP